MEKLLEDYIIIPFAGDQTDKTLEKVVKVIIATRQFRMKRRDLFVAIGSTLVTDIIGFAAAIYRRSTPYISVLTDLIGIVYYYRDDNKVSINHVNKDGEIYRGIFTLSHLPIASFYDPNFFNSLHKNEIKRSLAEIVKVAVVKDDALFSRVEANLDRISTGTQGGGNLITIAELAAWAAFKESSKDSRRGSSHLSWPDLATKQYKQ